MQVIEVRSSFENFSNSEKERPPTGSPVLSGVRLRETMCGDPGVGSNGPKSLPPPR